MKICGQSILCLLALSSGLVSCRGPLPSEADLDRAYKYSQKMAQQDIQELDNRRAKGQISNTDYIVAKQEIMDRTTARANELVLTQTALVQSSRQATGLPTPETPQDISVPQSGSLSTGTARRSFNDSGGNADGTGSGLGFLPGGSIGLGLAGYNGVAGAPVVAVAQAPVVQVQQQQAAPPSPQGSANTVKTTTGGGGSGGVAKVGR